MTKLTDERTAQVKDLLFRKGLRDTRQIADYLGMSITAARKFLLTLSDAHLLDIYAPIGVGTTANQWCLTDQAEPMDPMTRLKEDYAEPKVFILHCQRLTEERGHPHLEYYDVVVTVVPQTKSGAPWRDRITGQTGWRAYSREWGAGKPGFGMPDSAARCLASKVSASIVSMEEAGDIFSIPASPGQIQAAHA